MGFLSEAVPILQVISLLAGIAVAVVTFMYYQHKLAIERLEDRAIIAAAALRAEAELTAAALRAQAQSQVQIDGGPHGLGG